jgi:hypothetical protein
MVLRAMKRPDLRAGALLTAIIAVCGTAWAMPAQASALPDGRAYELASPPDKNGGDVLANAARTHVATDGSAVAFASLTGFGDAVGTGITTEYLAERSSDSNPGTNGWATHAITPPQGQLSFVASAHGIEPLYVGDMSSDLSRGLFRAWTLLSDAPNVRNVANVYLRTDLRSPGAGTYQLFSDAVAPVGSTTDMFQNLTAPVMAGASADLEHLLFEERVSLTADATGSGPWLYEADHGTVRLAGVLSDGTPVSRALAGQGAANLLYTPHTISENGLRMFFTDPSTGVDGSDGTLYMRETDPATEIRTTVQLNSSERTVPDPNGTQPATYWDASASGTRVFFTTGEALTDDAPTGGIRKLYMYDTSKPDSDPHNLTLISVDQQPADDADVEGVIGASADGHYVYFIAVGQLVSTASAPILGIDRGIYVWHDGTISYIGMLKDVDDETVDLGFYGWVVGRSQARVTPDGRHLLFMSTSGTGLTGYDHGSCANNSASGQCRETYVYSADSGQLACASCIPSGAPATSDAELQVQTHTSASSTSWAKSRAISDDGRRVFFTTGDALVPEDTNVRLDAYEYDVPTGTVHLLTTGKDPSDSYFLNATASGEDVFVLTRQQLVGWDTDGAYDLYDVRVGGGFPEPKRVLPCAGDSCHGTPSGIPEAFTPGSTSVVRSSGHVTGAKKTTVRRKAAPVRCKRGFVRKRVKGKVRCIKRRHRAAKKAGAGPRGQ